MGSDSPNFFQKHREWINYLLFGMLTTLVNYSVYLPLYNNIEWSAAVCNMIAWIISVIFSFWVNRFFVFRSQGSVLGEFIRFVGSRLGSGIAETAVLFLLSDHLCMNGNTIKLFAGFVTVILNYVTGKLFVFRK